MICCQKLVLARLSIGVPPSLRKVIGLCLYTFQGDYYWIQVYHSPHTPLEDSIWCSKHDVELELDNDRCIIGVSKIDYLGPALLPHVLLQQCNLLLPKTRTDLSITHRIMEQSMKLGLHYIGRALL